MCGKPFDTLIDGWSARFSQTFFPQITAHSTPYTHRHPHSEQRCHSKLIPIHRNFLSIFHENPIIYCQFIACDSFFPEFLQFFIRISMMTFIRSIEWAGKKLAKNKIKSNNSNSIHLSQSNQYSERCTLFHALASCGDVDVCDARIHESSVGYFCCYSISISFFFFFIVKVSNNTCCPLLPAVLTRNGHNLLILYMAFYAIWTFFRLGDFIVWCLLMWACENRFTVGFLSYFWNQKLYCMLLHNISVKDFIISGSKMSNNDNKSTKQC